MFQYGDPTGTGLLEAEGALQFYRETLHVEYRRGARRAGSAFTLLDAFDSLSAGELPHQSTVGWIAFPRTAGVSDHQIDADRDLQDEYVEWTVQRATDGSIKAITFSTQFPEYFEALAAAGVGSLVRGVQESIPHANPTVDDLFGPGFDPGQATSEARTQQFRAHLSRNPWNRGPQGILCLVQPANTLGALTTLVVECAVPRDGVDPDTVCGGGFCVPERNSDPVVCSGVQQLASSDRGLSLADPAGIRILRLEGIWKIDGRQVDINDPAHNAGAWVVSQNGRRGMLRLDTGLTLGDDPVASGADVARNLRVGATVISAPEVSLPPWATTGHESSRRIV